MRRHRRRWLVALVVVAVVLAAFYGSAHLLTGRYAWARAVAWGVSDVGDQDRFPARTIEAGAQVSPLPTGPEPVRLEAPVDVAGVGRSVDGFLADTGTFAFLVVQHDQLVYERYFHGAGEQDLQTSFSAAKSFVSTLVGLAADQGLLEVTDPVTAYLPELAERDERFADITVEDLLTMSSGLHYTEQGLPWSDDALTYYGTDLRELALSRTTVDEPPGRTWRYDNFHPLLLGMVLERVTDMTVSDFMAENLWQPLGAEADATWSLDSEASGFEKMESGVNARPRDYARFGLMMLHGGRWNGQQIVSRDWVRRATAASRETDPADFYQYLWWVGPPEPEGPPSFYAHGKYGQLIGVFPAQDAVIVRMGSTDAGVDWQSWLRALAARISA